MRDVSVLDRSFMVHPVHDVSRGGIQEVTEVTCLEGRFEWKFHRKRRKYTSNSVPWIDLRDCAAPTAASMRSSAAFGSLLQLYEKGNETGILNSQPADTNVE